MTTPRPKSTLQDELLADLRVAAPIPVAPPKTETPKTPKAETPEPGAPAPSADETPTLSLRVTPWRWARPSLHHVPGERATLRVGPLQISVTGVDKWRR